MRRRLRGLVGVLFAALFALPLAPLGTPAAADLQATTAADYAVTSPPVTALEPAPVQTFVNSSILAYPEISFDSSGNIVLAYHDNASATFTRFNQTTTEALTAPTKVSARTTSDAPWTDTGRGPHAALDGLNQIVTAYWDYLDNGSFLADRVYLAVHRLDGVQVLDEVFIGDSQSVFWPSPSVAVGLNDSVYIAREIPAGDYNWSGIGLEHRATDGSAIFANLTVFNDSSTNHHPQLVADLPRARLILAWYNDIGEQRYVAVALNGSILWGPTAVQTSDRSFSFTVGPDGAIYAVFIDSLGDVRSSKLASNGTVVVNSSLVASTPGNWARVPRCALSPLGELYIVWEEEDGTGYGDVRARAVNSSDLAPLLAATWVSSDSGDSQMPHIAFSPAGVPWVVWRAVDPIFGQPDRINGTSLRTAKFSFEAHTPAQNLTVYRGVPADIPVNLTSFSETQLTFSVGYTPSNLRGPWNWTFEILDAATGRPVSAFDLMGNASASVLVRVTPPVWDPPDNGLFLFVNLRETRLSDVSLSLMLNITVQAGHFYSFTPPDQNATGLPGSTAQLSYQVRNVGVFEADNIPFTLLPPPPPGWSAVITPAAFSALPGGTQVVTLTITSPPEGTTADAYCGQLRVQNPVDVFSLATGGFCSRVALVTVPRVTPSSQSITVDPAYTATVGFTLENVGNSALALTCHLGVAQALPPGWSVPGAPLAIALLRNTPTAVSLGVVAPPAAAGGLRLDLTVQAYCDGGSAVQNASVAVTVREIHDPRWSVADTLAQANATGEASFTVTLDNLGNLPEALGASALVVPRGWTIAIDWSIGLAPADTVNPGETASARIAVRAPPRVLANNYRFDVSLEAGANPGHWVSLVVEVPVTAGIVADLGPAMLSAGPGEVVSFVGPVTHVGNAAEIYQMRVTVTSPQLWLWTAEFLAPTGAVNVSVSGGYLTFPPYAEGTLYVYLTAPAVPSMGDLEVKVSLTTSMGASASFTGSIRVRLPDLQVAIDAVPEGLADPLLVGGVKVNVTCTGGVLVDNVTLRVVVDNVRVFDSPVGPFCEPGARSYEITVGVAQGVHRVTATVDPDQPGASAIYGFILEADEENNAATRTFSVQAAPPPPPLVSNTTGAELAGSAFLLAIAAGGGAASVVALAAFRQRRRRSREP